MTTATVHLADRFLEPHVVAAGPLIRLFGTPQVIGATGEVGRRRRSLTELAAYLVLFPGGDQHRLDRALWPDGTARINRNSQMSRLRRWLGSTVGGDSYVPYVADADGYVLHPAVRCDWHEWRALIGPNVGDTCTPTLQAALARVGDAPFAAINPRRYAWADEAIADMTSAVVDVSAEVARRSLRDGDPRAAFTATRVGLTTEPVSELLWRYKLMATAMGGTSTSLSAAVAVLRARNAQLGCDLEPETLDLIKTLTRTSLSRSRTARHACVTAHKTRMSRHAQKRHVTR